MKASGPSVQPSFIPKDGLGPRGAPDCYYTSRVSDSTARYSNFVKKLRIIEEEDRVSALDQLQKKQAQQTLDFFQKCDRKHMINYLSHRVEMCLESYENDIEKKREKLKELLTTEEQVNMRKFVENAQSGVYLRRQAVIDRLAYLEAKRKKEHEEKYKDIPISKCAHVLPCIAKLRAKETAEIQLYQMEEKQLRKLADAEIEKMWYEVAMKEAEVLRDLSICNSKMIEMKNSLAQVKVNNEPLIEAEGRRIQDAADLRRCQQRLKQKEQRMINKKYILEQQTTKEQQKVAEKAATTERDEYFKQVDNQLDLLVKHKELTASQVRRMHQNDLLGQMKYSTLLKERAKQEEIDQLKKCQIATREYQEEINKMLRRPYFTDELHPFMKQMADMNKKMTCPCTVGGLQAELPMTK